MNILATIALMLVLTLATSAQDNGVAPSETGHYGKPVSSNVQPVKLSEAVSAGLVNKPCVVTAEVVDVCSAKGCWLMLKDGDTEVRVTFKDYGFFVPSSLKGTTVLVQGVLSEEIITEADRRHYAEDAGMSDEEIMQITGDATEYAFEATGVKGESE